MLSAMHAPMVTLLSACGLPLLLLAAPVRAVEPAAPDSGLEAQVSEFRALVGAGRYLRALEELRHIARQVQEQRLLAIRPLFPAPPPGWTAAAPASSAGQEEAWSRRLAARREYRREEDGAIVEITLDYHGPELAGAALAFNPLFVVGDARARLLEVGGQKARATFDPGTGDGDLRIILGREVLVTVRGRHLPSDAPLADFAARLDLPAVLARAAD